MTFIFAISWALCGMLFRAMSRPFIRNPYNRAVFLVWGALAGPLVLLLLAFEEVMANHARNWDKKHPPINATAYTDEPCRQSRKEGYQAGKVTAYTEAEMRHSRQRVRWKNDLMAMQGKIAILKNENNKLRNKLYRQQKDKP